MIMFSRTFISLRDAYAYDRRSVLKTIVYYIHVALTSFTFPS